MRMFQIEIGKTFEHRQRTWRRIHVREKIEDEWFLHGSWGVPEKPYKIIHHYYNKLSLEKRVLDNWVKDPQEKVQFHWIDNN